MIGLQRKLGHSSVAMANRYVHQASAQERVPLMDKLDTRLMNVPKAR